MMLLAVWLMYSAQKPQAESGKWQCAVEMLVDMVSEQAKSIVHGDRTFIAPLALTVFVWVTLMNAIDLIPVDLIPAICGWFGIHYMRPLPTADLNGSMGISVGVLLLMIYYGIKIKGPAGFGKELFTAPFGNFILLWPFNFLLNIIEYLAKQFLSACDFSVICMRVNSCSSSLRSSPECFGKEKSDLCFRCTRPVLCRSLLVVIPYSYRVASGLHYDDVDSRLHWSVSRRTLILSFF